MRKYAGGLLIALILAGCRSGQMAETNVFSFGVMADIQYADRDPNGIKHFRTSLNRLETAVDDLNRQDLLFTIQLGDIIDGSDSPDKTLEELDAVLVEYNKLNMPAYHVIGNHCLTAGVEALKKKLPLKKLYYDFVPDGTKGWRCVVLNSSDVEPGVVGDAQKEWLQTTLAKANTHGEKVIIFSHHALTKEAAPNVRMTNNDEVLPIVENAGCVVAVFAGHDHVGGYGLRNGIHHITLHSILTAPEQNAYAVITVSPDGLIENGAGDEPDREMPLLERIPQ
ncbi:MAG: metallophosphoesterase [Pontiellaceae bacterium]|nr:metallophosphoesterase [Pontiellaceae bacterium]